jgi:hypothetical protein
LATGSGGGAAAFAAGARAGFFALVLGLLSAFAAGFVRLVLAICSVSPR